MSGSITVRRFEGGDEQEVVPLLYESSGGMYDRFAGSRELAERTIRHALAREDTTASSDIVWVAQVDGQLCGAMAAMPYEQWTPRAQSFLRTTLRSIPVWRWPSALWMYRSSDRVAPDPPQRCLYVDSLATAPDKRRRGVARALLGEAERMAVRSGLRAVALDTWQDNRPARALYMQAGFEEVAFTPPVGATPAGVSLLKEL